MHAVIIDNLEDYLSGSLGIAGQREIESHLSVCGDCREELAGMREMSHLFGSLRSDDILESAPGFYAGVLRQIEDLKPAPAFGGLFNLDFAFGRRLVFASLMVLAVLGSYLVAHDSNYSAPSPNAIMAQQDSPEFDSAEAHNSMLITLAAYGE